jgi:hypothetical protein
VTTGQLLSPYKTIQETMMLYLAEITTVNNVTGMLIISIKIKN